MGALTVLRDDGKGDDARARAALARRGFANMRTQTVPGWRILHADPMHGGPEAFLQRGADWVAVAGTPVLGRSMGRRALELLLDTVGLPDLDRAAIGGQFAAVVHRRGRTFLFGDALGALQIYRDTDARVFSTSFLAARAALNHVTLDPQGVYEWAFNVVPVGDDTILAEVKTLGPESLVEFEPDRARLHAVACPIRIADPLSAPERLERSAALLLDLAREQVDHFGDAIHVPLSGGLDSRLVLATLRAAGARPKVYVYGGPALPDVVIARAIGVAEGFAVDCIEKARIADRDPDALAHHAQQVFDRSDGPPNYGNIFDGGAGLTAQAARHAPGHLAVSGGAGEVYRDFFRLPDRPLPVTTVTSAFFSRVSRACATSRFDPAVFHTRIDAKLAHAIGAADPRDAVARPVIELLYPRVRCRALFGRELTLEAGYGSYFLPFLDQRVIADGAALPMREKQTGRFEAALVAAIDPALARHTSTYGHAFDTPPPLRRHVSEWWSRCRPAWVRRRTYAVRHWAGRPEDPFEHGAPLAPDLIARVIDPDMPIMRDYFDVPALAADWGLWLRVASLEYAATRLLADR